MIWQLHRGCVDVSFFSLADDLTVATSKDKIIWECENGGQLWGESAVAGYNDSGFPNAICGPGWQSLFTAFIVSLLVDLGFQVRTKVFSRTAGLLTSPIFYSSWDPGRDRRCTLSSSTGASRDG
jgi:hypothetical protein